VLRSRESLETEILFLRRQLAMYQERDVRPKRVDAATRVALKLPAFCDGAIGHTHAPASGSHGVPPQLGPDDGLVAQAKGVAYVMSTVGIMRVTRRGANNYAATLVDGKWGEFESSVKDRLVKWNNYVGKWGQRLGKGNSKCNQIY
jgi:hypothetical protein